MTNPHQVSSSSDVEAIYQLLATYSFDPEAYPAEVVIAGWLEQFGSVWVSHAITEALYQGRYKLISIDQILQLWHRRGQPIRHFNREFESIILGQTLLLPTSYSDGARVSTPKQPTTSTGAAKRRQTTVAAPSAVQGDESTEPSAPQDEEHRVDPGSDRPADLDDQGAIAESAPAPHSREVIPNFRPLVPDLAIAWVQAEAIQPFVPQREESDLHQRLRAVVQAGRGE
jgi:hypothetical protein